MKRLLGVGSNGYRCSYSQLKVAEMGMLNYVPENNNKELLKIIFRFKEGRRKSCSL